VRIERFATCVRALDVQVVGSPAAAWSGPTAAAATRSADVDARADPATIAAGVRQVRAALGQNA